MPAPANARSFQLSKKNPRSSPKTFGSMRSTSGRRVGVTFIGQGFYALCAAASGACGSGEDSVRAFGHGRKGHDRDTLGQGVAPRAGIEHRQMIELQVLERDAHRGRYRRRVRPLDLDAEPAAPLEQQQVEFRALMRGPEVRLLGLHRLERFLDGVALPGGAALGMSEQFALGVDSEQGMQQAGVADVYLGRLDLAFA